MPTARSGARANAEQEALSAYSPVCACGQPPENTMPEQTHPTASSSTDDYDRYQKLDDADYDRVNEFIRDYVNFTAREWAVARLCADFRTETGVEMTKVGENLPELVPFVTEQYSRQAVGQARHDFEQKVRAAGATFLYGAYAGFLTAEEVDDVMYEATEVAKFLLEVEGTSLSHEAETTAEERAKEAMRSVHDASVDVRYDSCPHCGERLDESDNGNEGTDGDDSADDDDSADGDDSAADAS